MDIAHDDTHNDKWWSIRETLSFDDAERERQILRQRAEAYAAPLQEADAYTDVLTLLTFHLGAEYYALEAQIVRGVRPLPKMTPVPSVPPFYRGVVNLRGQIITVLDLTAFFKLDPDPDAQELVVVEANGLTLGILARHVQDVIRLRRSALQPFEHFRYTLGVTVERLVVLDIPLLLQDERLIVGTADDY